MWETMTIIMPALTSIQGNGGLAPNTWYMRLEQQWNVQDGTSSTISRNQHKGELINKSNG